MNPAPLQFCAVSGDANDPLVQRLHPEPAHAYRSAFQRDRGRIIHARAFRRLAGKTQVFTHRYSDHFRSRLTHTIEVAQIARTAAHALGLNEDLAETLALVHDIGHPPFGHAGEQALNAAWMQYGHHFDHNLHALRIVEHFEQRYVGFRGLNLTLAVREGIVKHSRDYQQDQHPELAEYFLEQRPPLEAQIIDLADEIAYLTADIDDGIESEILQLSDVRAHVPLFENFFHQLATEHPHTPEKLLLQEALKRMLDALAGDLISATVAQVHAAGVQSLVDVRACPHRLVSFSPGMEAQRHQAKKYLFARLYDSPELMRDHQLGGRMIGDLFAHWMRVPEELPPSHVARVAEEGASRVVADYIAGMTDAFCMQQWNAVRAQSTSS